MRRVARAAGAILIGLALLAVLAVPASAQRLLFVSDDGTTQPGLSVFSIGAGGGLTAVPGSPFATGGSGGGADSVVLTPDGKHAYVTNFSGNSVSGFSVGSTGALTTLSGSPYAAGTQPVGLALTPDGHYLYATNGGTNDVSAFSIGSNGVLTAIPGSPFTLGSGQGGPGFPALTPNGRYLYVPDTQGVVAFAVQTNGSLVPAPGSPYAIPGSLNAPAAGVTPAGNELLIGLGYGADSVAAYAIAASGALTPLAGSPFGTGHTGGTPDMAVSPTGGSLYLVGGTTLGGMSIGAGGALSVLPGTPYAFPGAVAPQAVAVAPGGGEVFASDVSKKVQPYAVQANGALTPIGSPVPTSGGAPDQGSVTVGPVDGPTAAFTVGAQPQGLPTTFSAGASSSPNGTVVQYLWNFGDGATTTSTTPTVSHTYAHPGAYNAVLTVIDNAGCSVVGPYTGQSPSCVTDPGASVSQGVTINASHSITVGNQRVTLITPAPLVCQGSSGSLAASLSATKLNHGKTAKFVRASFYLGKGIKHTHKVRRHGKSVKVTTYTPNAITYALPANKQLSLQGLKAGSHTLKVVFDFRETKTVRVHHGSKRTKVKKKVTVTRTLSVTFTIC